MTDATSGISALIFSSIGIGATFSPPAVMINSKQIVEQKILKLEIKLSFEKNCVH